MTDDEQGVRERQDAAAASARLPADDRRDVRSEAEGVVPGEKVPSGDADPMVAQDIPDVQGVQDVLDSRGGVETGEGTSGPADHDEPAGRDDEAEGGSGKAGRSPGSFWKELPVLIAVALILALVIKSFVVQAFYIPSQSMENTLKVGDRVLVNKVVYHTRDIHRGDVVVFNGLDSWDPEVTVKKPANPVSKAVRAVGNAFGMVPGEKDYIKRVIGVPGDRVQCCDPQQRVTVNGVPLDETSYLYTDPATKVQNRPSIKSFSFTVPKGRLWVMGDHREVSYDSRDHTGDQGGGSIPESRVIGRAFVVVWPLDRIATLPIPKTFRRPALAAATLPAVPPVLALAGALPVTLLQRRLRLRMRDRRAGSGRRR